MMRWALGLWVVVLWGCGGEPGDPWRPVLEAQDIGWLMDAAATRGGGSWWAVGGRPEQGQIWSGQGDAPFAPQDVPDVPLLNWVHPFAEDDVFAVGNAGTVLHYDGSGWRAQEVPTEEDLWGVWGASPNDVWAVGGAGRQAGQATLLHFDGSAWEARALPELARPGVWALFKVWGTAADDVYAVGQRGALLHYDGQAWREVPLDTVEDLVALWGTGPDRIAIVGGRSNGVLVTWDGQTWTVHGLAPLPGLSGVWMGQPDTVHVGGIEGTLAEVDFDTAAVREFPQDTRRTFHAVHGAGGRLMAVGGNLTATRPPYAGIARQRELSP